jgi:tRNA 5-methylaminomethyl-2-thiouridine biosynthesis bifunctional protein
LPVVGEVIDFKESLKKFPRLIFGQKVKGEDLPRTKNLYIINGFGGRGFVFGAYLAKIISEFIIEKKPIEKELNIDRIFFRYVKRLR